MTQPLVLSQMQVQQGFRKLADQRVDMVNGQTLTIKHFGAAQLRRRHAARGRPGGGFQAEADKLDESISLSSARS